MRRLHPIRVLWLFLLVAPTTKSCNCNSLNGYGMFKTELNEFLTREFVEECYSGVKVRVTAARVLRFIMESGAKGCEVVVSGKLSGQRSNSMKFVDGLMIHSGDPCNDYIETATRQVLLRQGVLGIKVKVMLPYDLNNKIGTKKPLPDNVFVVDPKEEKIYDTPETEYKIPAPTKPLGEDVEAS